MSLLTAVFFFILMPALLPAVRLFVHLDREAHVAQGIDDFHVWSLDGIDSVLTVKVSIDNWQMQDKIKKEIYTIASRYHIVDITIEFDENMLVII